MSEEQQQQQQQRGLVYLLTGGSGFLGRHLLRLLLEKEEQLKEVRVFDKRPDATLSGLSSGETRPGKSTGTPTEMQPRGLL